MTRSRTEFEALIECIALNHPSKCISAVRDVLVHDAEQRRVIEDQAKEIASLKSDISHWTLERFNQQIQDIQRLREALSAYIALTASPCRFDHHGNCQEHFLTNPCIVSSAQRVLEETAS